MFELLWLMAAEKEAKIETTERVKTSSGLMYHITQVGTGPAAQIGNTAYVHYELKVFKSDQTNNDIGSLEDGKTLDSSRDRNVTYKFVLGKHQVIKGWDEGVVGMRVGEKRTLIIPPALAWGDKNHGPIPPNRTVRFEIELLEIKSNSSNS